MHAPVLHLDADAFFASVEQRDDPRLRNRPVAVGTGVVASCSYEARRHGVRTAMRLSEARRLCRELLVLPGEYPRYEQVARQLLALCRERTPAVESAALDDLYLDLSRGHDAAERVARELRTQVRDEIRISISIGIGANKLVAAVATKEAKPGRQVQVPEGNERAYLAPWPARVLPGIGAKAEARLDRLNVQRVGELAQVPVPIMQRLFGPNHGRQLRGFAHGIDPRPVVADRRPASISRRTSFDPPAGEPAFLRAMLDYLLERAASWMRFQGLAAGRLRVLLSYNDNQWVDGQEPLAPPTGRGDLLREAARDRFARLYTRRLPLRLLGVELAALAPALAQGRLFADPEEERQQRLSECTDAIRRRFGFTSLFHADQLVLTSQLPHDRENFKLRTPCLTR